MSSEFWVYLQLGFEHIADLKAYDHMLFLVALCAVFHPRNWREILILVSAFTVGHTLTLGLSATGILRIPSDLIEFLIPLTILLTALLNVRSLPAETGRTGRMAKYLMVLFFGFIHGLGFSNYLRALLGEEESIVWALLAFNAGLEIGQLLIVLCIMSVAWLLLAKLRAPQRDWILFLSGAAAGVALLLMQQAVFW